MNSADPGKPVILSPIPFAPVWLDSASSHEVK